MTGECEVGTIRKMLDDKRCVFLHQRLKDIPMELAQRLGILAEWEGLREREVSCHRGNSVVRRRIIELAHNLSRVWPPGSPPEGFLAC